MNFEILIPITFLLLVTFVIKYYLNYKREKVVLWHQSFQLLIQNNTKIDEQQIDNLLAVVDPQQHDKRKSLLLFTLGILILILGLTIPFQDPQGNYALLTVASFPLTFSLLFYLLSRYWYR